MQVSRLRPQPVDSSVSFAPTTIDSTVSFGDKSIDGSVSFGATSIHSSVSFGAMSQEKMLVLSQAASETWSADMDQVLAKGQY